MVNIVNHLWFIVLNDLIASVGSKTLSMGPETEQATASIDVMPSAVDPAASAPATGQKQRMLQ